MTGMRPAAVSVTARSPLHARHDSASGSRPVVPTGTTPCDPSAICHSINDTSDLKSTAPSAKGVTSAGIDPLNIPVLPDNRFQGQARLVIFSTPGCQAVRPHNSPERQKLQVNMVPRRSTLPGFMAVLAIAAASWATPAAAGPADDAEAFARLLDEAQRQDWIMPSPRPGTYPTRLRCRSMNGCGCETEPMTGTTIPTSWTITPTGRG